jgi:hypothetical protein
MSISCQHVLVCIIGLLCTFPSLALSPTKVEGEAIVVFEKGSIALSASQRQLLADEAARILAQHPCRIQFGISAYGDRNLSSAAMRSLALDRARYIESIFKRLKLDLPLAQIFVGGDHPTEEKLLGTGGITIYGYVGALGCGR